MLWPWNEPEFWTTVVGGAIVAIVTLVLGIPVALFLNRLFIRRGEEMEVQRRHATELEKARVALSQLKDEIEHNSDLVDQLLTELPEQVVFYNLQTSNWAVTNPATLEVRTEQPLISAMPRLYYEFEHINRKLDIQFQLNYGVLRASSNYHDIRASLVEPTVAHLRVLRGQIDAVLKSIDEILG